MAKLISDLENLKKVLPGSCSFNNLQKLQLAWKEFNGILSRLPQEYFGLHSSVSVNLERVRVKIDAILDNGGSSRGARATFLEAIEEFRKEIDAVITNIQTKSVPQCDQITNEPLNGDGVSIRTEF